MLGVTRMCCLILEVFLLAGLVVWTAAAPLVWIVRDGLGPKAVDSAGMLSVMKFAREWGVRALALTMPLIGLVVFERLLKEADAAVEMGED